MSDLHRFARHRDDDDTGFSISNEWSSVCFCVALTVSLSAYFHDQKNYRQDEFAMVLPETIHLANSDLHRSILSASSENITSSTTCRPRH